MEKWQCANSCVGHQRVRELTYGPLKCELLYGSLRSIWVTKDYVVLHGSLKSM